MKKNFEEQLGDLFGETEMSSFEESWGRPFFGMREYPLGFKSSNDNSPKSKKGNENG